MEGELENKSTGIGIRVNTLIPCKLVYPYAEHGGIPQYHTCVEVFRHLTFFDFPSLPRNFYAFLLLDASKNSYEIGMNIVDQNGNKLITENIQKIDVPSDNAPFDFVHLFQNVIFPNAGKYFFQLIVNNKVIYRYDFKAVKIQRREYSPEEVENILDDPETIKSVSAVLKCLSCGYSKKFSLTLNPEKQKAEEKLPEENIITCEECGKEHSIAEIKANMHFYLGSKNLIDTFNRNLNESRTLAANGFLNSSLIMQVSAFEAYMRDSFMLNYKNWFIYLIDNKNDLNRNIKTIKEKIIHITEQMRLKDQFYDQIFLLGNQEYKSELDEVYNYNRALKTLLFGEDGEELNTINKIISFQQLKGQFGCFWAYKHFFGIELGEELKRQTDNYFEHLLESFQIRHRIIHGSSRIQLPMQEIDSDMIKKNERSIIFSRQTIKEKIKKIEDARKEIEKNMDSNSPDLRQS
jgi:hypothetical protein